MPTPLEDYEGTIKVGGRIITNLRYADVVLITGSVKELHKLNRHQFPCPYHYSLPSLPLPLYRHEIPPLPYPASTTAAINAPPFPCPYHDRHQFLCPYPYHHKHYSPWPAMPLPAKTFNSLPPPFPCPSHYGHQFPYPLSPPNRHAPSNPCPPMPLSIPNPCPDYHVRRGT
ncbi:extensin-like [Penaeus japonicus]|uniref:extensin-like n=1 Tax=Penaeus japonicus TaxID=27405 RepID=UPI001C713B6F|nr:extensin-like [Penaeus japonicus]